jgi:hypothetical protein
MSAVLVESETKEDPGFSASAAVSRRSYGNVPTVTVGLVAARV